MPTLWKRIWTDQPSRWLLLTSSLFVLASWGGMWLLVPRHEQFVPVHYTIYFDIDLTGPWTRWLQLPITATLAWLTALAAAAWRAEPIWLRLWWLMALLVQGLLLAAFIAVWLTILRTA